jgi:hypothetical protein
MNSSDYNDKLKQFNTFITELYEKHNKLLVYGINDDIHYLRSLSDDKKIQYNLRKYKNEYDTIVICEFVEYHKKNIPYALKIILYENKNLFDKNSDSIISKTRYVYWSDRDIENLNAMTDDKILHAIKIIYLFGQATYYNASYVMYKKLSKKKTFYYKMDNKDEIKSKNDLLKFVYDNKKKNGIEIYLFYRVGKNICLDMYHSNEGQLITDLPNTKNNRICMGNDDGKMNMADAKQLIKILENNHRICAGRTIAECKLISNEADKINKIATEFDKEVSNTLFYYYYCPQGKGRVKFIMSLPNNSDNNQGEIINFIDRKKNMKNEDEPDDIPCFIIQCQYEVDDEYGNEDIKIIQNLYEITESNGKYQLKHGVTSKGNDSGDLLKNINEIIGSNVFRCMLKYKSIDELMTTNFLVGTDIHWRLLGNSLLQHNAWCSDYANTSLSKITKSFYKNEGSDLKTQLNKQHEWIEKHGINQKTKYLIRSISDLIIEKLKHCLTNDDIYIVLLMFVNNYINNELKNEHGYDLIYSPMVKYGFTITEEVIDGVAFKSKKYLKFDTLSLKYKFSVYQWVAEDDDLTNIYFNDFVVNNKLQDFANNMHICIPCNMKKIYSKKILNKLPESILSEPHRDYIIEYFGLVKKHPNTQILPNDSEMNIADVDKYAQKVDDIIDEYLDNLKKFDDVKTSIRKSYDKEAIKTLGETYLSKLTNICQVLYGINKTMQHLQSVYTDNNAISTLADKSSSYSDKCLESHKEMVNKINNLTNKRHDKIDTSVKVSKNNEIDEIEQRVNAFDENIDNIKEKIKNTNNVMDVTNIFDSVIKKEKDIQNDISRLSDSTTSDKDIQRLKKLDDHLRVDIHNNRLVGELNTTYTAKLNELKQNEMNKLNLKIESIKDIETEIHKLNDEMKKYRATTLTMPNIKKILTKMKNYDEIQEFINKTKRGIQSVDELGVNINKIINKQYDKTKDLKVKDLAVKVAVLVRSFRTSAKKVIYNLNNESNNYKPQEPVKVLDEGTIKKINDSIQIKKYDSKGNEITETEQSIMNNDAKFKEFIADQKKPLSTRKFKFNEEEKCNYVKNLYGNLSIESDKEAHDFIRYHCMSKEEKYIEDMEEDLKIIIKQFTNMQNNIIPEINSLKEANSKLESMVGYKNEFKKKYKDYLTEITDKDTLKTIKKTRKEYIKLRDEVMLELEKNIKKYKNEEKQQSTKSEEDTNLEQKEKPEEPEEKTAKKKELIEEKEILSPQEIAKKKAGIPTFDNSKPKSPENPVIWGDQCIKYYKMYPEIKKWKPSELYDMVNMFFNNNAQFYKKMGNYQKRDKLLYKLSGDLAGAGKDFDFYYTPTSISNYITNEISIKTDKFWDCVQNENEEMAYKILEPSAGLGHLIIPLIQKAINEDKLIYVDLVEFLPDFVTYLKDIFNGLPIVNVIEHDFLTLKTNKLYDICVSNPPFTGRIERGGKHINMKDFYILFMLKCMTLLDKFSEAYFVLPTGALNYFNVNDTKNLQKNDDIEFQPFKKNVSLIKTMKEGMPELYKIIKDDITEEKYDDSNGDTLKSKKSKKIEYSFDYSGSWNFIQYNLPQDIDKKSKQDKKNYKFQRVMKGIPQDMKIQTVLLRYSVS